METFQIKMQQVSFFKKAINATHTQRPIAGIENMHMVHKGQIEGIRCVQSEVKLCVKHHRIIILPR